MAAVLAGEAAVRIVPTLRGFHNRVATELKRQPHSISVNVNADTSKAARELERWRARERLDAVNVPVKADFQSFRRDLSQIEHVFKRSSLSRAIRLNVKVIGLDALPALAYAAGSAASSLDALGKSAFALPGLLGGALASVGALAVGLQGVGDAFKAYGEDAANAAENARKVRDADRDLISAKRDLRNAIRDQRREIEDLNSELRRSSLNEADALLNVQEAVDRLREGGFKSITEFQRAQLGLLQSVDRLNEVRKNTARTAQDAAQANTDGVAQSDRVVDALDKIADATERVNASNVTKVSEALAKLSPNMRAAVEATHAFSDEWASLQQSVSNNLAEDLDKVITDLGNRGLPVLENGLSKVAQGLNSNIKSIAGTLGGDQNLGLFDRIFGNTEGGLENAARGMKPLIDGVVRLTEVGSRFLPRLGDAFDRVATRFDNFITRADEDGSLVRWIDQGLDALTSLGNAAINVGSIISSIGEAFNAATNSQGGLIGSLERGTKTLADFLKTTEGQGTLVSYFQRAKEFVTGILEAIRPLRSLIGDLVDTAREWSGYLFDVAGAFAEVAGWIERNTGLLKPLLMAYLTIRTVRPLVEGLTGAWKNYNTTIRALANFDLTSKYFTPAANGAIVLREEFKKLGSEAGTAAGKANGPSVGSLGGSLKSLGAFIGPGLAFTGAIIGLTALTTKLGEAHAKAAEDADKQRASLDQLKNSLDSVSGAATQQTLNDNARAIQGYDIPGLGNRNVASDAARAGIGTPEQILAATIPTQQGTRNTLLAEADSQTEAKIAQSETWRRFGSTWQEHGVDISTLAKAANGDPASKAKVDQAMGQILNEQNIPDFLPDSVKQPLIASKRAAGHVPDDLTGVINNAGAFDSASTAIFIRDRSQTAVNEGNLIRGASDLAFGRGALNDAGKAVFGADGAVTLDANGNAIIQTSREPNVPPELGTAAKTAFGWQVQLTGPGTSQYVQKFADGGLVRGRGTGTSDSNIAMLSRGEWVTRAKAVDHYGQTFFDDLNNMRLPKFNTGGWFGPRPPIPPPAPVRPATPPPTVLTPGSFRPSVPGLSPTLTPVGTPNVTQPPPQLAPVPSAPPLQRSTFDRLKGFNPRPLALDQYNAAGLLNQQVSIGARATGKPTSSNTVGPNALAANFGRTLGPPGGWGAPPKPPTPPVRPPSTPPVPHGNSTGAPGPHNAGSTPGVPARLPGPSVPSTGSVPTPPPAINVAPGVPLGTRIGREEGLQINTIGVKRAIEAAFPQITDIGGFREDALKWHPNGLAIDVMIPGAGGLNDPTPPEGKALGDQIYEYVMANKEAFGVDYVMWQEKDHFNHLHINTTGGGYPTGSETYQLPAGAAAAFGNQDIAALAGLPPNALTPQGQAPLDALLQSVLPGGGQEIPGLPPHLQPQAVTDFLGSTAQDVGSQLLQIGTQFLSGITGIDFSSLLSVGQQIGNFAIGQAGGIGPGGGGSSLNAEAGANMEAFVNGQLPTSLSPDMLGQLGIDPGQLGLGGGGGSGGGAERWRPLVRQILDQVAPQYGINNKKAWEDAIIKQIDHESKGDPGALNPQDSDGLPAIGLGQFKQATFDAHNVLGGDINDPAAQIYAMIDYVSKKYGMDASGGPNKIGRGTGYKRGGQIKGKGGVDSILARVSRGEFLNNAASVKHYGPGLFASLNAMQIPKESLPGFNTGMQWLPQAPLPTPPPVPPPAPPPAAPPTGVPTPAPAAGAPGQAAGPLALPPPSVSAGAAAVRASSAPSTGGAPGPGATAPAPETSPLPQVTDALAGLAGAAAGTPGAGGAPQPGASPSNPGDNRGTLGAAPATQEHNNPGLKAGIEQGAAHIGQLLATAASAAGGAAGAVAPGAGQGAAAAGAAIQAGAQIAGKVASGAVNILSSLAVGTLTGGSTAQASGVPLLPQRQPMQTGVPPVQNDNRQYHLTNLDEYRALQERQMAQQTMPWVGKF